MLTPLEQCFEREKPDGERMSQVTEAVLSLQHDLRDYHENTEKCYVHLRHLIKKVEDGIIVIPQDQRDECIKLLKKTKDTSNELMECFHNLAKLADEGCDKIQAQNCDVTSQSLDRLKQSTCDNVLRRSKHARGKLCAGINIFYLYII